MSQPSQRAPIHSKVALEWNQQLDFPTFLSVEAQPGEKKKSLISPLFAAFL